jgi:hypothetical protein
VLIIFKIVFLSFIFDLEELSLFSCLGLEVRFGKTVLFVSSGSGKEVLSGSGNGGTSSRGCSSSSKLLSGKCLLSKENLLIDGNSLGIVLKL